MCLKETENGEQERNIRDLRGGTDSATSSRSASQKCKRGSQKKASILVHAYSLAQKVGERDRNHSMEYLQPWAACIQEHFFFHPSLPTIKSLSSRCLSSVCSHTFLWGNRAESWVCYCPLLLRSAVLAQTFSMELALSLLPRLRVGFPGRLCVPCQVIPRLKTTGCAALAGVCQTLAHPPMWNIRCFLGTW